MIIWIGRTFANDHPDGPAFCKWSSRWAFCKWPSGWACLLQTNIQMGRPFANDHPDGLAFCKWSSGWAFCKQPSGWACKQSSGCTSVLQIIIRMGWPFANDHPDFFLSTRFFSIFLFIFSKLLIFIQQTSSSKHFFFFFKSEDQGSISRTFLYQSVLVFLLVVPSSVDESQVSEPSSAYFRSQALLSREKYF